MSAVTRMEEWPSISETDFIGTPCAIAATRRNVGARAATIGRCRRARSRRRSPGGSCRGRRRCRTACGTRGHAERAVRLHSAPAASRSAAWRLRCSRSALARLAEVDGARGRLRLRLRQAKLGRALAVVVAFRPRERSADDERRRLRRGSRRTIRRRGSLAASEPGRQHDDPRGPRADARLYRRGGRARPSRASSCDPGERAPRRRT